MLYLASQVIAPLAQNWERDRGGGDVREAYTLWKNIQYRA